ncbi:radial spoke head protein 9 homolog [Adelges cooleyi]|uniref:radial spoke head protein 9 homolog n=1 Tax=Adelges cooleyi TaxID=133065 RepID=UPI0021807890|nr:radial spoke head protein 9 homolog [Adelges cooleyi]
MDVKYLFSSVDMLKTANCSINEDLIPVLYDSLIRLQSENHFNSVYLWGRLQTLSDDYFLAYGHYGNPVNKKTFFYSQNVIEWSLIPTDYPADGSDLVKTMKDRFKGDPRHVQMANLFKPWTDQMAENNTPSNMSADVYGEGEGEEIVPEGRSKNVRASDVLSLFEMEEGAMTEIYGSRDSDATKMIKEEDRLAVTVDMIENETHVVPRGFLYKLPNGNIVNAPYYKGCWAPQIIFNRYFVMHNLLWPGAVFFQDMNTGVHGFFYNGDGIKNLDLPFMLKC